MEGEMLLNTWVLPIVKTNYLYNGLNMSVYHYI